MDKIFEQLENYNFWNKKVISLGFKRNLYLKKVLKYVENNLIKIFVGQRRVGKSYLMRQIIHFLIEEKNVNPRNIFYFNKEFIGFDEVETYKDLENLFEFYKKQLKVKGKIYIFIDEIQNIKEWEKFVNSYSQDYTSKYELFITGSNSKLLSGELATLLSGRFVEFEIYPFSYSEFLEINNFENNKDNFFRYIYNGGLPEMLHFDEDEIKQNYISGLKNTVIIRDIMSRYIIKDVVLLEDIFKFISLNIGHLFSISNVIEFFKTKSKKTNYETVSSYISYLLETFVIKEVDRYNIRGKDILGGVKKYYLNDLAFRNYLFGIQPNEINMCLENFIFNELKRKGFKIYVGILSGKEIDFVATKNTQTVYLQAAYSVSGEDTFKREFGNLLSIKDNYEKYVVSLDDLKYDGYEGIKHLRAWEIDQIE